VRQLFTPNFGVVWGGGEPQFWGSLTEEPPNLVQTIVSQTSSSSYIVCFNFLCSTVQKFHFGGAVLGGSPPGRPPNLVQTTVSQTTSYITSFNFLCSVVQKFLFGRAILEWKDEICPSKRTPNLVQIIVSQTTSYIMSFNFLC